MSRSSDRFAISLPVDPADRYRLVVLALSAGAATALLLLTVTAGAGRLAVTAPLVCALACAGRLWCSAPLPRRVRYRPARGWSLGFDDRRVDAVLLSGSWFGRRCALAEFRTADGRRHLVPLRAPRDPAEADWRRLRVLWRTRADALVANSSNC